MVRSFLTANSVISLWLQQPEIMNGRVSFTGGIPGGYCGEIPGDSGESNILGEIVFQVPRFLVSDKDIAEVQFLANSEAHLNDGLGTEIRLKLKNAQYRILNETEELSERILEKELEEDDVPPESFGIVVLKDPQIFEGKYFVVFNAQDKQTGIDHYEILEKRPEQRKKWKIAKSPYLLEDQTLRSIIEIKAIDKAGNERLSEFKPYLFRKPPFLLYITTGILILIGIGIVWWFIKHRAAKTITKYE